MAKGFPRILTRMKPATDTVQGPVLQAANQPASVAADVAALVVDHNALLVKLKAAGLMVAD